MGAHLVSATPPPGGYSPYTPDATPDAEAPVWWRRSWVLALAGLVVGAGLGAGIGVAASPGADPEDSPAYRSLAAEKKQLGIELDAVRGPLAELSQRKRELDDLEAELDQRLAEVNALEQNVEKRERAVTRTENTIERGTLRDGVYEVGADIKAGTYKTKGGPDCYWERTRGAGGDIIANHFGNGPAVVTVNRGETLELSCSGAGWTLQR